MDINELFRGCKKGDLLRVQHLVEQKEVDVNVRDNFDSTPLYYACLCGHTEIVEYLLEKGARCEANTFDGERCMYGALNDDIRKWLKKYRVVTAKILRRDCYDEFLQKCLDGDEYCDISFTVEGETFFLHKCILSARSEFFSEKFLNKWQSRKNVYISHPRATASIFKLILQYLYTGSLEVHIDQVEDLVLLAKQCQLPNLVKELEGTVRKAETFQGMKPGTNVTTLVLEQNIHILELQEDFGILALQATPVDLINWVGGSELPFMPNLENNVFADVCFNVEGKLFYCHQVFFCGRSDYFKALLNDHFAEIEFAADSNIPIYTLHNITVDVFMHVLFYVYQNVTDINSNSVYDVLVAADMYLLPGLKRQCASFIALQLDISNVVNIVKMARFFELPRLEDICTEFMAKHLESIIATPEFHSLVEVDAQEVKHRQETDSISVIDDIRYHISENVQTFSAVAEANEKLSLIDDLLEKLGLDA